jgi:putative sterol carrier protein
VIGEREVFHPNLQRALEGDATPLPDFDLATLNEAQIAANRARPIADLLAEASVTVDETGEMLAQLSGEDFERPAWNPITPGTLGFYVKGRIWEWWTHGQDVRVPLRRPGGREPDRTRPVVEVIRDGIAGVFRPEKSKGVHVTYSFEVGDVAFTVHIEDGSCRVTEGFDRKAATRVKAEPATFCLVSTRRIPQWKAVLTGKFKASGNLLAGMKFLTYFAAP